MCTPSAARRRRLTDKGPLRRGRCRRKIARRTLVLRALANTRAPAEEVLDLLLVTVWLLHTAEHRAKPQVLAELDDGLARRVAELETRRLQLAVVEPPPISELKQHFGRELDARPPQRCCRKS